MARKHFTRREHPNIGLSDPRLQMRAARRLGVGEPLAGLVARQREKLSHRQIQIPHMMSGEVVIVPVDLSGYHATGGAEGLAPVPT